MFFFIMCIVFCLVENEKKNEMSTYCCSVSVRKHHITIPSFTCAAKQQMFDVHDSTGSAV